MLICSIVWCWGWQLTTCSDILLVVIGWFSMLRLARTLVTRLAQVVWVRLGRLGLPGQTYIVILCLLLVKTLVPALEVVGLDVWVSIFSSLLCLLQG